MTTSAARGVRVVAPSTKPVVLKRRGVERLRLVARASRRGVALGLGD